MDNAILIGLSRQMALHRELEVVANNVANINTTGYKADGAVFEEFLSPKASHGHFSGGDRQMALHRELEVVANNVANINTTGYKADGAVFEEFLSPKASHGHFSGGDR